MSDLLEDQKIHYIVKDYRRMYNMHNTLIDYVKQLKVENEHQANRIRDLEKQVENLKKQLLLPPPPPPAPIIPKEVKGSLSDIETLTTATIRKLEKRIAALSKIIENAQNIKEKLYSQT